MTVSQNIEIKRIVSPKTGNMIIKKKCVHNINYLFLNYKNNKSSQDNTVRNSYKKKEIGKMHEYHQNEKNLYLFQH